MKKLLLAVFVMLFAAACGDSPLKPSDVGRDLRNGAPLYPVLEIVHIQSNEIQVRGWGNWLVGLREQPKEGYSIDGGNWVVYDYSSGTREFERAAINSSQPRENTNSTVIPRMTVANCEINLAFAVDVVRFTPSKDVYVIPHTMEAVELLYHNTAFTLRIEGDRVKGRIKNCAVPDLNSLLER